MPPKIQPKKEKLSWKIAGELRRSQMISTYGSGAIADFPRLSGIMSGLDSWTVSMLPESAKIHEKNLQKMLGKDHFIQISPDERFDNQFGMPVYRFPDMYYCPECHKLDRYRNIRKVNTGNSQYNSDLVCSFCHQKTGKNIKLVPSRFIVACENGHLDDFPYDWWVHRKKGRCGNPKLFLRYEGATGGLDSIQISCECGANESMAGCMNKDALKSIHCFGKMPWLGFTDKGWYQEPEACHASLRTMQRGANNVYYPVTQSALTIPPWSSRIQRIIENHSEILDDINDEEDIEFQERRLKKHFEKFINQYKCSFDSFKREFQRAYNDDSTPVTPETLRIDEYMAFCNDDVDEDNFKTESSDIPEDLAEYFDIIKIVKRLREVKVLRGFRRIEPSYESSERVRAEKGLYDREFTPISRQPLPWLPGLEMYGEGIFLKLNEAKLSEWEKNNRDRYRELAARADLIPWVGKKMFSSGNVRYVLLHTLSHLIIKQLTAQCGYTSASLTEKIYSTINGSDVSMCGILIYTSATDTDGSLGGLAREGEGERMKNTLFAALEEASWCSNDPICISSKSQGYRSLNYAACHACSLLPETSCESSNCLLDRASIVGIPENRKVGFFNELM